MAGAPSGAPVLFYETGRQERKEERNSRRPRGSRGRAIFLGRDLRYAPDVPRKTFHYLAAALCFWGVGHVGHRRADNDRFATSIDEVYRFVPNGYAVRIVALGYHTMVADLTWVRAVLLFAETKQDKDSPENKLLAGMLRTVSVLDPHW